MLVLSLVLTLSGCSTKPLPADSGTSDDPAEGSTGEGGGVDWDDDGGDDGDDTQSPAEDDTGSTGDSGEASSSGGDDTGTQSPSERPVRFIAFGDGGEGNDDQYQNANAVYDVCAAKTDAYPGCDFALYMGDNFYDTGVTSVDDEQFETKFELPYANLDFPFYVVPGNHDYGYTTLEQYKIDYEIEYTEYSDKWTMPAAYYQYAYEDVEFFAMDTSAIYTGYLLGWTSVDEQLDWLSTAIPASTAKWKIAFAHHPYRSNGKHGNAGNYEGWWLGSWVEDMFEDYLCYEIDMFLCGHDHNRQWLEPQCGMELIVSGAAAKTTDLEHHDDNPTFWEDETTEGFVWIEIVGDTLTGEFYDMHGDLNYTRSISK